MTGFNIYAFLDNFFVYNTGRHQSGLVIPLKVDYQKLYDFISGHGTIQKAFIWGQKVPLPPHSRFESINYDDSQKVSLALSSYLAQIIPTIPDSGDSNKIMIWTDNTDIINGISVICETHNNFGDKCWLEIWTTHEKLDSVKGLIDPSRGCFKSISRGEWRQFIKRKS